MAADLFSSTRRLTEARFFGQPTGTGGPISITAGSGITVAPSPIVGAGVVSLTSPVLVTLGGTGTVTQFTQGSVVFAGAGGVYSQDNASFFWDNTNKRIGIGTNAPETSLHVAGTELFKGILSHSVGSANGPGLVLRKSRGTQGAPTAINTGDRLGALILQGYGNTFYATGASFDAVATQPWTDVNQGTAAEVTVTPNGGGASTVAQYWDQNNFSGFGNQNPEVQIDNSGAFQLRGMAAPAVSSAGNGRLYFDSTSKTFKTSRDTGPYVDLQLAMTIRVNGVADGKSTPVATMAAGSSTITVGGGGAVFDPSDVGKTIWVFRGGVAGATLKTTISVYVNPGQATLAATASTAVTNGYCMWGTDNTAAYQAAVATANASAYATVEWAQGVYCIDGAGSFTTQYVGLAGQGSGVTTLLQGSTSLNAVQFSFPGASLRVQGISIVGPGTPSAAAGISYTNGCSSGSLIFDVYLSGLNDGIIIGGAPGSDPELNNVWILDCNNTYVDTTSGVRWQSGFGFSPVVNVTVTTSPGSPNIVTSGGSTLSTKDIGKRIAIPGAGPAGALLTTTIATVTSTTTGTMTANATIGVGPVTGTTSFNTQAGVNMKDFLLILHDVQIVGTFAPLNIVPGNGQSVTYSLVSDSFFDSAWGNNVNIAPSGTGTVVSLVFDSCWFASCLGDGVNMGGTTSVSAVEFANCRFVNNVGHGLSDTGHRAINLTGCIFDGNGSADAHALFSGTTGVAARGCAFRSLDFLAGTPAHALTLTNVAGNLIVEGASFGTLGGTPINETGTTATLSTKRYSAVGGALPAVTAPAFPASTASVTNATGQEITAYILTPGGCTVSVIKVGGVTTGLTMAASSGATVTIPAGATFTPTYVAGPPTWVWIGQ